MLLLLLSLLPPDPEDWLEVLRTGDVERRREAEHALAQAGPALRPRLEALRADADPELRLAAGRLLELLNLRASLPAAVGRALPEYSSLLAQGRWSDALAALTEIEAKLPGPDVRRAAALALRAAQRREETDEFCALARDRGLAFAAEAVADVHRSSTGERRDLCWSALQTLVPRLYAGGLERGGVLDGVRVEDGTEVPRLGVRVTRAGLLNLEFAPLGDFSQAGISPLRP